MSEQTPVIEPEMIPYGTKAVLICMENGPWRDSAKSFFASQKYYVIDEPDESTAVAKLKLNAVDVVLTGSAKAAVAEELASRPGLRRRETALMLVGPAASLDAWAAFQAGADWTLAESDAPRAAELISESLKRHEASREPWRLAQE